MDDLNYSTDFAFLSLDDKLFYSLVFDVGKSGKKVSPAEDEKAKVKNRVANHGQLAPMKRISGFFFSSLLHP